VAEPVLAPRGCRDAGSLCFGGLPVGVLTIPAQRQPRPIYGIFVAMTVMN
jgi:hypothetical protein